MARINMTLEGVGRCPQCGVAKPQLAYKHHFLYPENGNSNGLVWFVYQCTSCFDLVAARAMVNKYELQNGASAYLGSREIYSNIIVPKIREIDHDIPDRPKRYLEQAVASIGAPDGAIMLAGSAIDAMLKIKGYEEGSVYSRIEKAVNDGILTANMSEWAHAVRLESNKPRHADLDEPHATPELAEQTIGFAEALAQYLFILPARVQRGKMATEKAIEARK